MWTVIIAVTVGIFLLTLFDLFQRKHAILRNFPIIGHFRYLLEAVGPELRQYIVTSNDEELPFNRDERRWVYASSKKQNNYFGFGSDNNMELSPHYLVLRQSAFPLVTPLPGSPDYDPLYSIPCAKVLGEARDRKKKFRMNSVVNISAMSYGSLSSAAIEALNLGAAECGCLHNTGEGGISPYHQKGGDLIYQVGTGYFGCRAENDGFDIDKFLVTSAYESVKAVEVKLSQGAKPGLGGLLPASKITAEISKIRGIPRGKDCASPSCHSAFSDVDSLLDFVESLADRTGLPIGIKSAVGDLQFWRDLAAAMADGKRGVDYISIDGGEGGTGAAPLAFSDHVALPFKVGFVQVYRIFAQAGLTDDVVFMGAGKLGFPENALFALAMGCDAVYVAREPMMAIGCIQAQRCHSGHCPTGVATQNAWLVRGLDPTSKAHRCANYMVTLRKELLQLCHAAGKPHPSLVTLDCFEVIDDRLGSRSAAEHFDYQEGWGRPVAADAWLSPPTSSG